MIDPDHIAQATRASAWLDVMAALRDALGLRAVLVDLATGVTLWGGEPMESCDVGRSPGPGCLGTTERGLDRSDLRPTRALCDDGLPVLLQPVVVGGEPAAHLLLYGFVTSDKERTKVMRRAADAGRSDADARAVARDLALLEWTQVEASARLAATLLARAAAEADEAQRRVGRQLEVALLADVARDLGPVGLVYDRIPASSLSTLVRLTGATCARLTLLRGGRLEAAAQVGDVERYLGEPEADETVRHALETGRSLIVSGADTTGEKATTMTAPLGRGRAGALTVVKAGTAGLAADDVRLVELFAEIVSAMLDNARDFVEANTRLIEMIQLGEVAMALNSTLDYERLSELAVQVLSKTLDFTVGGFVIEGFGTRRGRVLHAHGVSEVDVATVLGEAEGCASDASILAGVELVRRADAADETVEDRGEWTVLARDLHFRNMRAGSLFVATAAEGAFRGDDERVLGALAAHLSIALENAMLYDRLSEDFTRAMAALSVVADATERLEAGHTDRVMDHSVAIGHAMGLPLERVGLLRFAGLLHDLGKIGVAEDILIKPSALTEEELVRVRRHSEVGASIVEQVAVLEELTPIVRHHHERWDGGGYPDGLAGDAIPLEARILAVADSYEAMTGKRTHRKRVAPSVARAELERGAGTQFDPRVVVAFLEVLDRRALGAQLGGAAAVFHEPHLPA